MACETFSGQQTPLSPAASDQERAVLSCFFFFSVKCCVLVSIVLSGGSLLFSLSFVAEFFLVCF